MAQGCWPVVAVACRVTVLQATVQLETTVEHTGAGSRHTQGQPAFVKQGSEAYLVVKSEAVKQEKERI